MEKYLNSAEIERFAQSVWEWLSAHVFIWPTAVQAAIVVAALLLARGLAPHLASLIERAAQHPRCPVWLAPKVRAQAPLSFAFVWLVVQWFTVFAAIGAEWPHRLMESVVSLLTAWVVIRFASSFIRDPGWSRSLAIVAWSVAALNLVGLLDPTIRTLDNMGMSLGDIRLSMLGIIKAGLVLAVLLWLAGAVSRLIEHRLENSSALSPSARVLLGKFIKILLITIAILAALESIGIDLTALAVFGGAIGLGIGFGLQKVISNLISGVILLMDKSVKPGDVIAIEGTFGWINRLSARYVSVITRDGTEHLIPNEDLISQRVENWSYSDSLIRLKLPIGVSYDSDVELAMELAVEATKDVERALKNPAPVCRLMNFGSDSVELELRVWIADPKKGVANVQSDILLTVWKLYHEHGVEFPFAQRDLHIKSSVPLDVRLADGKKADPEA
ncbi:mechanosensitive ion channel [Thalassospiraceae bacterium LMO-JJ14]|nr:mechanosensitive ion channel [Thalassospiraceae bacterium LMO-JJ14]